MPVLVLLYHRARAGADGNSAEMLDAHFGQIARRCRNVLPGEALPDDRLNVCITFDDATFDFYRTVYPLLRKHGLRAVLAVAPGVIRDQTDAPESRRLALGSEEAFRRPADGGFCTWSELAILAASGHVALAAHGYSHRRLDEPNTDGALEIEAPQVVLSERLGQPVDCFAFPYGRFSPSTLAKARRTYRYVFRIGGAWNDGWDAPLLYRVGADALTAPDSVFRPGRLLAYRVRRHWNRLRRR